MGRELTADQLAEQWTLDPADWEWLSNKTGATRLGFSALLEVPSEFGLKARLGRHMSIEWSTYKGDRAVSGHSLEQHNKRCFDP
jgi:hypothetical protein